jgi:hypothetical protein
MAGPLEQHGVPYLLLSSAQTIPLDVPLAETEGVAPGNPKDPFEREVEEVLNLPVEGFNENALTGPPTPSK